jgi:hypothetical protein
MAELAEDRPKPKPPRLSHLLACAIEAGVVATFIAHRSIVGLLLCVGYAWFSATCALAFRDAE